MDQYIAVGIISLCSLISFIISRIIYHKRLKRRKERSKLSAEEVYEQIMEKKNDKC